VGFSPLISSVNLAGAITASFVRRNKIAANWMIHPLDFDFNGGGFFVVVEGQFYRGFGDFWAQIDGEDVGESVAKTVC
jgi:hypothetical protein